MSVTREKLFEEVWAEPMTIVARKYSVSSSYLARVCFHMGIPRPSRGFWAKLAAGQPPERPQLSPANPEDETEWTPGGRTNYYDRPRRHLTLSTPSQLPPPRRSQHPLVVAAAAQFQDARQGFLEKYLKPKKRKVVDVWASREGLARALKLANELFLLLERRGHRVVLAPHHLGLHRARLEYRVPARRNGYDYGDRWSPMLPTVAFIGTVAFGLTIFEISEETNVRRVDGKWQRVRGKVPTTSVASSWDPAGVQRREIPSGKFGVHAYAPYGVGWERYWREERPNTLKAQFDEIAVALEAGAPEIVKLVEEAEREAERRKREWEAEEREEKRRQQERRRAEALKNSREQLLSIVESWTRARQLEYFFAEMKTASKQLESEEAAVVERRLARARELFGGPEALNHFRAWKAPEER